MFNNGTVTLPILNNDFVVDVVRISKKYANDDLKWILNQTFTHTASVYSCILGNVGPRNQGQFDLLFNATKDKYEKKNKLFSSKMKTFRPR